MTMKDLDPRRHQEQGPLTPYGRAMDDGRVAVERTPEEQIADLMKPLVNAGQRLAEVRRGARQANENLRQAEEQFGELASQMTQALEQHRMGPQGLGS